MLLQVSTVVLVLLGLVLLALGLRRLWRRCLVTGTLQGLTGLLLLAGAALAVALALNLHTYQRLTHESPLAKIRVQALGPQDYRVYLIPTGGKAMSFELLGDQWQLDARILKWRGAATWLGLNTVYRLDRLSGRYRSVDQARSAPHTVYQLSDERGLDLWSLARRHPGWVPWLDAVYGSAAYMPLANGARYAASVSNTGLVARPLNEQARRAVEQWQ